MFIRKISVILLALLFLQGCLFTYVVKSGYQQMSILSKREPIEKVVESDEISPEDKRKLLLAIAARDFAVNELNLKPSDNYKTYVDLKRPYVSYIVTAAKKFRLESHLFSFPLVGKLPYKGYFEKSEAEEAAKEFDQKYYDVQVRGVTAYSTLGWFEDPILNTMLNTEDHHLVNLIIHESTHATIYIKSQADFNERLATFIGDKGTELFYRKKEGNGSKTLNRIRDESADELIFSKFLGDELELLKKWYAGIPEKPDGDYEKVAAERTEKLKDIVIRFNKDIKPKLKTDRYERFGQQPLNNAGLLHLSTYVGELDDFDKAFAAHGGDFKKFLSFCRSLEKASDPAAALRALTAPDPSQSQ